MPPSLKWPCIHCALSKLIWYSSRDGGERLVYGYKNTRLHEHCDFHVPCLARVLRYGLCAAGGALVPHREQLELLLQFHKSYAKLTDICC